MYLGRGRRPRGSEAPTHKRCGRCCLIKPIDQFQKRRTGSELLQSYCESCNSAAGCEFAKRNRVNINIAARERRKVDPEFARRTGRWAAENPDKAKQIRSRHYTKHGERIREKRRARHSSSKEIAAAKYREWRVKNPDKNAAKAAAYYARKIRAIPAWADLRKIEEVYRSCAELNSLDGGDRQVDHVVPLCSPIVCGLHVPANLQILDRQENQSKGNRRWPDMP